MPKPEPLTPEQEAVVSQAVLEVIGPVMEELTTLRRENRQLRASLDLALVLLDRRR